MPPLTLPAKLFISAIRHPRVLMADVARLSDVGQARLAMLALGALHAGFSLLLHVSGHNPKMGIPRLGNEGHYLWQAIFVIPLYLILFWCGAMVAHALARRLGGQGSREASMAVFGVAYAVPMTLLFIVPDVVVYFVFGFASIGKAMRWYAPLAAISCVWLGASGLANAHRIGKGRAAIAALMGFVAQALVGGAFLR